MTDRTRRQRGAILPMTALSLSVVVLMTSFAVDLGRVQLERRDLQSVADSVALDMVRQLEISGNAAAWAAALTDSRDRNDFTASGTESDGFRDLVATPGCYDDPTDDFTATGATCISPLVPAVRVVATDTVDYLFQPGSKRTSRESIAIEPVEAAFRVGSFLAGIDPATNSIIGQLLNAVIPGATVVGYSGLADANVTFEALAANVPVTVGSPEELLDTQVTMADIIVASAGALEDSGNAADAAVLNSLLGFAISSAEFRFGDVIGVAAGGTSPGGSVVFNVPQLLMSSVFLADSDHFITVPASTLNIPFVGDVDLELTGIEAPQLGGRREGAFVTTEQVSLTITPHLNISTSQTLDVCSLPGGEQGLLQTLVGGVLNLLTCLLGGVLNRVFTLELSGNPSISVTAGEMTVTQHIDCDAKQLTLTPTPVALSLNSNVQLTARATLLGNPLGDLLRINLAATAASYGSSTPVVFTATDAGPLHTVFSPTTARVGSSPLGLASLLNVSASEISVLNTNLAATANLLLPLFQSTVNTILGQLDTILIEPLAELLGLSIAGADLTPLELDCGTGGPELSR